MIDTDDDFDHIDSRGSEASTAMLPGMEAEEELEDIIECMPFWEVLQLCIEEDYTMSRLIWEDKYVWCYGPNYDLGIILVVTSEVDGGLTIYTPSQEDMFADDWIVDTDGTTIE